MKKVGLHVRGDQVPNADLKENPDWFRGPANMKTQWVGGSNVSIMVSSRQPGWHTLPHTHECEQMMYVISGHGWFFIEEEGFEFGPGDFFRVPANEIHWSWLRDEGVEYLQIHTPGLDIPIGEESRVFLLREDEEDPVLVPNVFPSAEEAEEIMRRVELKYVGETIE